jgi:hypothetical protein
VGQRMMIQYSVEEHELKHEVRRILSDALGRLVSIKATAPDVNQILTVSTIKEIESLREEIAKIDIMLEDTSAIVAGYVKHEYNSFMTPSSATEFSTDFNEVEQKINSLKQKIQHSNDIPNQRSET